MQVIPLKPLDNKTLEEIGLDWHTNDDMSSYIADEMVVVSQKEADAYYDACNELYDMFVETAEWAIQNDRFFELDIPNAPFL